MDTLRIPHQVPLSASTVLEQLARNSYVSLVMASNPGCARPGQPEHVVLFTETDERLKTVADVWLVPGAREEIADALGRTKQVTMACHSVPLVRGASIVWAERDGALYLWRCGRLVGRFKPGETELRRYYLGPWRKFANSRFSFTHGFLSASWLWRGVRLQGQDKRTFPIIHSMDPIVLLDPTYHGPDLSRDAGWVRDLARAISATTALPLKLDAPLD